MKLINPALILSILIGCSSCISLFADKKIYIDREFDGISDTPDSVLNIFITHGVGKQDIDFDEELRQGIFENMGDASPQLVKQEKYVLMGDAAEGSEVAVWVRAYFSSELQKSIRTFTLRWAPINQMERDYFMNEAGTAGADYDPRRSKIIKNVKQYVMTNSFIDFVRYTNSEVKLDLQNVFRNSITRMFLKDPFVPNDLVDEHFQDPNLLSPSIDFHLISGSLGSKITLDAFLNVLEKRPELGAGGGVFEIHHYMMSNQISFLQYLDDFQDSTATSPILRDLIKEVEIVAFNDPNDFLGFQLPQDLLAEYPKISVSNVSLRNKNFGLANPKVIHNDAKLNKKMHALIANGSDAEGKLKIRFTP